MGLYLIVVELRKAYYRSLLCFWLLQQMRTVLMPHAALNVSYITANCIKRTRNRKRWGLDYFLCDEVCGLEVDAKDESFVHTHNGLQHCLFVEQPHTSIKVSNLWVWSSCSMYNVKLCKKGEEIPALPISSRKGE